MKIFKWVLLAAVLIQFVPFGHTHTNLPVSGEPAWNSPQTRDLIHRACFDCHSMKPFGLGIPTSRRYRGFSRET